MKHNLFRTITALVCTMAIATGILMPKMEVQAEKEWTEDTAWNVITGGNSLCYTDDSVTYNGKPSIVIENTEAICYAIRRLMEVEPNSTYYFSAMVKYEGDQTDYGAGVADDSTSQGESNNTSEWKRVECKLTATEEGLIIPKLRNDTRGGNGKGKAYFSDIRLEKEESLETNEWNFLVLIFRNAKVDNAKTYYGDVRDWESSMTDEEVQLTIDAVNTLPNLFETMSEGKMQVEDFDIITIDKTLTELTYLSDELLYGMEPYDADFSEILDSYIGNKIYDQIICIADLEGVSGVGGLGGSTYKDAQFCQMTSISWFINKAGTTGVAGAVVHEVLHGLESRTKARDPEKYVGLHDGEINGYEYDEEYEYLEWYQTYMRCEVQGHLGVSPKAYINKRVTGRTLVKSGMMELDSRIDSGRTEMFRLYNPNSGEHFYTKDSNEKNSLVAYGWKYEGVGWTAPSSGDAVYRLYNANAGDHHYTMDENEKNALVNLGWKYEGIGWYSDTNKSIPLYRQYNPNAKAGSHNYTTDRNEATALVSYGWKDEGIAWYGVN